MKRTLNEQVNELLKDGISIDSIKIFLSLSIRTGFATEDEVNTILSTLE